jgi:hypothetical protein
MSMQVCIIGLLSFFVVVVFFLFSFLIGFFSFIYSFRFVLFSFATFWYDWCLLLVSASWCYSVPAVQVYPSDPPILANSNYNGLDYTIDSPIRTPMLAFQQRSPSIHQLLSQYDCSFVFVCANLLRNRDCDRWRPVCLARWCYGPRLESRNELES